ncbi:hypothetical protein [Streptomyces sp. NPDC052036]|uniref:hypothetical protein n=1 Tax=Streptomyces sp. NPDC052036 TaxID=3155171 RepID=UPI0034293DAE
MKAVLNEIDGYDHSRSHKVGTPAIFGLNFQGVSTAQKLPASDGLAGGYTAKNVPGPLLVKNLDFVNTEIGALTSEIGKRHLSGSTTVILSAKHGESPPTPPRSPASTTARCWTASTPPGRSSTPAPPTW